MHLNLCTSITVKVYFYRIQNQRFPIIYFLINYLLCTKIYYYFLFKYFIFAERIRFEQSFMVSVILTDGIQHLTIQGRRRLQSSHFYYTQSKQCTKAVNDVSYNKLIDSERGNICYGTKFNFGYNFFFYLFMYGQVKDFFFIITDK